MGLGLKFNPTEPFSGWNVPFRGTQSDVYTVQSTYASRQVRGAEHYSEIAFCNINIVKLPIRSAQSFSSYP